MNEDQWLTTQQRYFKSHPNGLVRTDLFSIYIHRKPHLLSAQVVRTRVWEPSTSKLFERVAHDGSIVVDVGANIGWFTLLAARHAGKVFAFEPEPDNFQLIRKSTKANKYRNVICRRVAISNKNGYVTLYLSTVSAGHHSLTKGTRNEAITVPSRTLDTLFPSETIDLLKIDVEGHEPEVLAGAKKLVRSGRVKNIVMEWNPVAWRGRLNLLEPFEIYEVNGTPIIPNSKKPVEENVYLRLKRGQAIAR